MRKCIFKQPFMLLIILFSTVACDDESPELPKPRTVIIEEVQLSGETKRRFSGKLQAAERSDLAFEVGGSIQAIYVGLGDSFSAGDVLAELDDSAFLLELASLQAILSEAEATAVDAKLNHQRLTSLKDTGAVSQSAFDRAQADLERSKAQVLARRADVERSIDRVNDTKLVAPYNGEVVDQLAEPSEVAAVGLPILKVIGTNSNLEAVIAVPASVRSEIKINQPVEIDLLSHNRHVFGVVSEVGKQGNVAGLFPITISLNESVKNVSSGESIEAIFTMKGNSNIEKVSIPLTAYIPLEKNKGKVFTVVQTKENQFNVKSVEVELGVLTDHYVQVFSGLKEGELIVTKGVELLSDEETVFVYGINSVEQYNH